MKFNVGGVDRVLRIVAGILLLGLMFSDALGMTDTVGRWGWIGLVLLVTGLMCWCPFYLPKGFNTYHRGSGSD